MSTDFQNPRASARGAVKMAEYCRKHSLNSDKVQQRLKRGYSVERAVQP